MQVMLSSPDVVQRVEQLEIGGFAFFVAVAAGVVVLGLDLTAVVVNDDQQELIVILCCFAPGFPVDADPAQPLQPVPAGSGVPGDIGGDIRQLLFRQAQGEQQQPAYSNNAVQGRRPSVSP